MEILIGSSVLGACIYYGLCEIAAAIKSRTLQVNVGPLPIIEVRTIGAQK